MSRFDWLMLIAVTVILTLLLSSTSLVQPVARAPDDQLAARIAAIDERLDQIDAAWPS